jgi:hypothetical protein
MNYLRRYFKENLNRSVELPMKQELARLYTSLNVSGLLPVESQYGI